MTQPLTSSEVAVHSDKIKERGYTIVEDVFDASEVAALLADLLRLEQELKVVPHNNPFEGSQTVRIYNLLVHGQRYVDIAQHGSVLPIVERVLGRECLISSISSIGIMPGEKAQPIHADDQVIPIAKPHAPLVCNSMWAITDFTAANGATRIIPESHTRDHNPTFGTTYETQPAEMKAGSVMIYDGAMWHGGGANETDLRRTGIAMNYCAGFIRQQENQQLGVPQELVKTMPTRVQELIGYSIYRALIGHVNHGHPGRLLK